LCPYAITWARGVIDLASTYNALVDIFSYKKGINKEIGRITITISDHPQLVPYFFNIINVINKKTPVERTHLKSKNNKVAKEKGTLI
jgi:hypothetical protein